MSFSDPVDTQSSGRTLVDGVLWGSQWSDGTPNRTSLAVHIAGTDGPQNFDFGGTTVTADTGAKEEAAFQLAMELFEAVCNIDFTVATSKGDADIVLGAVNNHDAFASLGIAVPPGEDVGPLHAQQGAVVVNYKAYQSDDLSSLEQGGYDFVTFIHELGHAVGLKHPHDRGGGVFPKFPGVSGAFGDYGDFGLNQGIFTMMSYNDGFPDGPLGQKRPDRMPDFGWEGTPMAIDIAALQHLYGANMDYRTGDDVYTLPAAEAAGAFFSCLWDAGGSDTIMAGSNEDCAIDLRAATLEIEVGGGGFLSSHAGIHGGFTIANGVVIENATGAGGKDYLTGNDVANVLEGEGDRDKLEGLGGADTLVGGSGADRLTGGKGADTCEGGSGGDRFVFLNARESTVAASDLIADFVAGFDVIDLEAIDADDSSAAVDDDFELIGDDEFSGTAGELRITTNSASTRTLVLGDINGDGRTDLRIELTGVLALGASDFNL